MGVAAVQKLEWGSGKAGWAGVEMVGGLAEAKRCGEEAAT